MTESQDLPILLDDYLKSPPDYVPKAWRTLMAALKQALADQRGEEVVSVFRRAIVPGLDFITLQSLCKFHNRLRQEHIIPPARKKLAVLGSFTTSQLVPFIELFSFAGGADIEVYEAEYGVFRQEVIDPDSPLYRTAPKIVWLATTWRDISRWPGVADSREQVDALVYAELGDWLSLWTTLHERLGCQVIQNGFELPVYPTLGNHEMRHPSGRGRFVAAMNRVFQEKAPPFVTIHDVDYLAGSVGRSSWSDERYYNEAKLPCAPAWLAEYAHNLTSILLASFGVSKKCLVLDLDNTLWGGIIGDDGLGGIKLGQGSGEGEAYLTFQRYIKALKERGVILAICSKNEDRIAREAFEKHPEMALALDDISCFIANWTDKASNIRTIAQRLNIGLDSLVFVDDNPAERAIIRQMVPEVAVPELPDDPAGYIRALDRHRYFQVVTLGKEDLKRTDYYRANAAREEAQATAGSIDEYLKSLDMEAVVGPVNSFTLERSVQLINKSNQFNLTTRRYATAEVLAMIQDANWLTLTVSLKDRFGDNGLISVILARIDGDALSIDSWLMSCRVLKRGVEALTLNLLCDLAVRRGLKRIVGEYIPTPKNDLVRNHYSSLGFSKTREESDGHTWWALDLNDQTRPLEHFIRVQHAGGERAGAS